jgi:staphyloferrin B biosynthesis citrate synthase
MEAIGLDFKSRFLAHEFLLGTFIKFAAPQAIEIIGGTGFDFIVIDGEHASLGRQEIDIALLASRASGIAALVRVSNEGAILSALDAGAAGVIVPHIDTAGRAELIASACRYHQGTRGFSMLTRAGAYGKRDMVDHLKFSDRSVIFIAMIEDQKALPNIDDIVRIDGVNGIFLGQADLAVSMGETTVGAPNVRGAIEKIAASANKASKPICAVASSDIEINWLRSLGVSAFLTGSDQGFLREGALRAKSKFQAN